MASTPSASPTTVPPSAVPRGPTGICSSSAPLVPLRPSFPASAGSEATHRRAKPASAPIASPRIPRLDCERLTYMVGILLEVVQSFGFHEHHKPTERGSDTGSIDVIDVDSARHR